MRNLCSELVYHVRLFLLLQDDLLNCLRYAAILDARERLVLVDPSQHVGISPLPFEGFPGHVLAVYHDECWVALDLVSFNE